MKKILPYLKQFIPYILLTIVFVAADVVGELLQPKLMSNIIDEGVASGDMKLILITGGQMVLLAIMAIVTGAGSMVFASKTGYGFGAKLRDAMFQKVQDYSFKNIDSFSASSLITRMTNDVNAVQMTFTMALRMIGRSLFVLLFSVFMTYTINKELSVIVFFSIPILIICLFVILRFGFPLFTKMQQAIDKVNGVVRESLTNIRVIKSFVRTDYEKEKFKKVNDNLMEKAIKANSVAILMMPVLMLVMNLTTLGVWWFGGNDFLGGTIKIGELNAFVNYITQILFSLMMLSMTLMMFSRAKASMNRIEEVLIAEPDITDPEKPCGSVKTGMVEFKDVCFKYDDDDEEYILKNINLTMKKGQVVAIVGATGSAKTTLIQLIPRLYDVNEGQVLVDGKDVRSYDLAHLRSQIGMVPQNNMLFTGTIKENIRWGKRDATDEEVIEACKSAQADDFIRSFPDGYDTRIEQGGVNVSGGQKQRLCIARAMVKQPKVLIMDDSTSAVDTATEAKIREAFQNSLKDTTKIIIAQRISSVSYADEIVVLDDGEVVGVGTHEELLSSNEIYQEIYNSQQKGVTA